VNVSTINPFSLAPTPMIFPTPPGAAAPPGGAPTFDATDVTMDSTTDTFDEE
jgi:hypothetical protein